MKSANDILLDQAVLHQILLLRLSSREVSKMLKLLKDSDKELLEKLEAGLTERGAGRLDMILAELQRVREQLTASIGQQLREVTPELAQQEADWQLQTLQAASPVELSLVAVSPSVLRAAAARPVNGVPLEGWLGDMAAADIRRIEQQIRLGVTAGESVPQMVQRIRGTKTNDFKDGVLDVTRRNAETIVRTAVNHVSNSARQETWTANADILKGLRWVSTLDGRTSPICRPRDGQIYPIDSGPRPPAHPGCRSTMSPILDGERIIGERPSVTDTRTRKKREIDFKKEAQAEAGDKWAKMTGSERNAATRKFRKKWTEENVGTVPSDITYNQWLRARPAEFQDEVLGPVRGRLFREGLSLDKFVDNSGHQYTLEQLKSRVDKDMRDLIKKLQEEK